MIVRPKGSQTEATIVLNVSEKLPVSISADIDLVVANERVQCGRLTAYRSPDRRLTGFGERSFSTILKTAPGPEIRHVDVVLTPNPKWIESVVSVQAIWGKPTLIQNIPLNRQDSKRSP